MVEWWRTSGDGSRRSMSPRGKFAHPMSIGFSSSICPDVIALNLWSGACPSVGERFMAFGISCGESDGFPIRPNEHPV
jgi:hypothetical protein